MTWPPRRVGGRGADHRTTAATSGLVAGTRNRGRGALPGGDFASRAGVLGCVRPAFPAAIEAIPGWLRRLLAGSVVFLAARWFLGGWGPPHRPVGGARPHGWRSPRFFLILSRNFTGPRPSRFVLVALDELVLEFRPIHKRAPAPPRSAQNCRRPRRGLVRTALAATVGSTSRGPRDQTAVTKARLTRRQTPVRYTAPDAAGATEDDPISGRGPTKRKPRRDAS